ncbi:hypothetical protein F1880_008092, partial [Penicillium rolfsii]
QRKENKSPGSSAHLRERFDGDILHDHSYIHRRHSHLSNLSRGEFTTPLKTSVQKIATVYPVGIGIFMEEDEGGMRRWTEGTSWSSSRVNSRFLAYRKLRSNPSND